MDITWIYWILGFYLVWILIRFSLVFRAIINLKCRIPCLDSANADEIPGDVASLIDCADRGLVKSGFRFLCYVEVKPAIYQTEDDECEFAKVFYHPDYATTATVTISSFWQLNNPVQITFETLFRDGKSLQTGSFLAGFGLPMNDLVNLSNAETHDPETQWEFHRERLERSDHGIPQAVNSRDDFMALARTSLEKLTDFWLSRGIFNRDKHSDTALILPLKSAFILTKNMYSALGKASKKAQRLDVVPADILKAWDRLIVKRLVNDTNQKTPWVTKFVFFVGSSLLFTVAFGIAFSWEFVPILLGVILFHELGHFYAMKWTGYKDLQIFFIPLLGAAATGKKQGATAAQQLFVYLMGPMPGLLISLPLMWYGLVEGHSTIEAIGAVAFIINYLNLLPITPLDGGRVLDTLLFSRFPRAQFIFSALSAAALLGSGLYLRDPILLAVGSILIISLPASWRLSRMNRELRQIRRQKPEESDSYQLTLGVIEAPALANLGRSHRLNSAKQIFHSAQVRHASPLVAILGLVIYVGCLVSPFAVVAGYGIYQLGPDGFSALYDALAQLDDELVTADNWQERLADAHSDEERLRILRDSVYALRQDSPDVAAANLERAIDLSYGLDPGNPLILETFYSLLVFRDDTGFRQAEIENAIEYYASLEQGADLLGDLYLIRARILPAGDDQMNAYLQAIRFLTDQRGSEGHEVFTARVELAKLQFQRGDFGAAEQLLRENLAIAKPGPATYWPYVDLLWLYTATNQYEKAAETGNALVNRLNEQPQELLDVQLPGLLEPLMWNECLHKVRDRCLGYMNDIVNAWSVQRAEAAGLSEVNLDYYDHRMYLARLTALHLLGDGEQAQTVAEELIQEYPQFRVPVQNQLEPVPESGWSQFRAGTHRRIAEKYRIAM